MAVPRDLTEEEVNALERSASLADAEMKEVEDRNKMLNTLFYDLIEILEDNGVTVAEWNKMLEQLGRRLDVIYGLTFKEIKSRFYDGSIGAGTSSKGSGERAVD